MYYILFYEVVDDYINKRAQYRSEHLELVNNAASENKLLFGGAYSNPADGAALIFNTDDSSYIEDFVNKDPYVKNGLITKWHIREWTVVAGKYFKQ